MCEFFVLLLYFKIFFGIFLNCLSVFFARGGVWGFFSKLIRLLLNFKKILKRKKTNINNLFVWRCGPFLLSKLDKRLESLAFLDNGASIEPPWLLQLDDGKGQDTKKICPITVNCVIVGGSGNYYKKLCFLKA